MAQGPHRCRITFQLEPFVSIAEQGLHQSVELWGLEHDDDLLCCPALLVPRGESPHSRRPVYRTVASALSAGVPARHCRSPSAPHSGGRGGEHVEMAKPGRMANLPESD